MKRSRCLLGVAAALYGSLSGCVWLFQEHESQPYVPNHEPRCTTSPGWWVLDGIGVPFDAALVVTKHDDGASLAIGLTSLAIDLTAAVTGIVWAGQCSDAREEYDARPTPAEIVRDPDREAAPAERRTRGWFCASSETTAGAGLCARDRQACEQAREAAAVAAPDLEPCEPVEAAWCFLLADGRRRCTVSEDACKEKQAHTTATVRIECEERR